MICADCHPPAEAPGLTSDVRLHPGHVGVRFGDVATDVLLDGVDVTRKTVEADDRAGWVLRITGVVCRTPDDELGHAQVEVVHGLVELRTRVD